MGTELDMEFQEAKARAWQKEVEAEIKDVNSLLEKINNTVATADPEHADDDFVKRINEVLSAEITGNYDGESSGNLAPLRAMEFFKNLQAFREERAQGALC